MNPYGCNSEHQRLASVLLYQPGPEIGNHPDPPSIHQLGPIDHGGLVREFHNLIQTYEGLGITVVQIDPTPLGENRSYRDNMMYCRDLLFMTPGGAVVSSMANQGRREEVSYAKRTLTRNGIPILWTVSGSGRFEGADALWVSDRQVVIGIGGRTNRDGFEQVKTVLEGLGVACVALPSHQTSTQHLLGTVQIVDRNLALVRHTIVHEDVLDFLQRQGFHVVAVPESLEVRTRQAMNIVTVAPRTVIMAAGCPETRSLFQEAGLTIAAELDITQLLQGAGGLACATGILSRAM